MSVEFLQPFEIVDGLAVDRFHQIARLKAGGRSRAVRFDPPDARHVFDATEGHKHSGENNEGQDEIGDRPCEHDRSAIAQPLSGEGHAPVDQRVGRACAALDARDIRVAVEFHIAAKRQRSDSPARAVRIDAGCEFRAEAERERVDFDAASPRNQIVTEFMEEHDRAQDHEERDYVPSEPGEQVG